MAKKKNTEAAEVKAEAVAEEVKPAVVEAPAKKPARKPAAKKAAEKAPAKKAAAPKETVKVQFGGDEYDFAEIRKAVEADYKAKVKGKIKTVDIYIKPEDKAVYYVVNSDFTDKVGL